MSKGLHKSNIDYIAESARLINRPGYVLNIVTGCKHGCPYCYARRMVECGRLKGHESYPYGFKPTFHAERMEPIGGKPKLIFLNDMGDVGGDWSWQAANDPGAYMLISPEGIAEAMYDFALLNPQHILLLLTKNPSWYRFVDWPDNVWCGFSASTGDDYRRHILTMEDLWSKDTKVKHVWVSLEPWLSDKAPGAPYSSWWYVIGGLSGRNGHGVSDATCDWLCDGSIHATRFMKANARCNPQGIKHDLHAYPDGWRVHPDGAGD